MLYTTSDMKKLKYTLYKLYTKVYNFYIVDNNENYTNYTCKFKNILKIYSILYSLICIITIYICICIISKNITCINSQYCTALS